VYIFCIVFILITSQVRVLFYFCVICICLFTSSIIIFIILCVYILYCLNLYLLLLYH
jgi:hypothetical protein